MTIAKDMTALGKMIAASHGWPAAKAFKSYPMSEADRHAIAASAVRLLEVFPKAPSAAAVMSAAFAVQLERVLNAPIHVVAGTLSVEGRPVFADHRPFDAAALLDGGQGWQGHIWVMIGAHVVDITLFGIAYSPSGPPELARHIDLTFGPGKGLYVDEWQRCRQRGLRYQPQHVLSEAEVTQLMGGAYRLIEAARSGSSTDARSSDTATPLQSG